jgi:hypothetical protein
MSKKINWSALIPTLILLGVVISPPSIAVITTDEQGIENTDLPDYILAKVDLRITREGRPGVIKGWHDFYAHQRNLFTLILLEQYFKETNNTIPWIRWHPHIPFIYKSYGNTTGSITDIRGTHNISNNHSFYIEDFRGLHVIYPNYENRIFGYCLSFDFYEQEYENASRTDEYCECEVKEQKFWQSPIICNKLLLPLFLISYFYWSIQSSPFQLALASLLLSLSERFNCSWFDFIPEDLTNSLLG